MRNLDPDGRDVVVRYAADPRKITPRMLFDLVVGVAKLKDATGEKHSRIEIVPFTDAFAGVDIDGADVTVVVIPPRRSELQLRRLFNDLPGVHQASWAKGVKASLDDPTNAGGIASEDSAALVETDSDLSVSVPHEGLHTLGLGTGHKGTPQGHHPDPDNLMHANPKRGSSVKKGQKRKAKEKLKIRKKRVERERRRERDAN